MTRISSAPAASLWSQLLSRMLWWKPVTWWQDVASCEWRRCVGVNRGPNRQEKPPKQWLEARMLMWNHVKSWANWTISQSLKLTCVMHPFTPYHPSSNHGLCKLSTCSAPQIPISIFPYGPYPHILTISSYSCPGKPGTPLLLEDGIMEVHGKDISQVNRSSDNSNSLNQWLVFRFEIVQVEQEDVQTFIPWSFGEVRKVERSERMQCQCA